MRVIVVLFIVITFSPMMASAQFQFRADSTVSAQIDSLLDPMLKGVELAQANPEFNRDALLGLNSKPFVSKYARELVFVGGSAATYALARLLGERGQFHFACDEWDSKSGAVLESDKIEHVLFWLPLGAAGLRSAIYIAIWNEWKDALFTYRRYGFPGGDGFSARDLAASVAGAVVGHVVYSGMKKIVKNIH